MEKIIWRRNHFYLNPQSDRMDENVLEQCFAFECVRWRFEGFENGII